MCVCVCMCTVCFAETGVIIIISFPELDKHVTTDVKCAAAVLEDSFVCVVVF